MILSAPSIQEREIVHPLAPRTRTARGISYGLGYCGVDLRVELTAIAHIPPGDFRLFTTQEYIDMPADVMGEAKDKSSWARVGLVVQNTIFEPGWRGYPTIEVTNHGDSPVELYCGDPITQMIFHVIDRECAGYDGAYQDQPQQATASVLETRGGKI